MAAIQTRENVHDLLAVAVEYPTADLPAQVWECADVLQGRAARRMGRFAHYVEQTPLAELEETYTTTFDLRPVCFPYIGFQLFGETYKRGEFMAALSARYRACGHTAGAELPDHLGAVLRYLALAPDPELVTEGMVPALQRMIAQLKGNPYQDALRAILVVVRA